MEEHNIRSKKELKKKIKKENKTLRYRNEIDYVKERVMFKFFNKKGSDLKWLEAKRQIMKRYIR